jgi:hypothetical protein
MVVVLKQGNGRLNASSLIWKTLVDLAEDETIRAVVVADAPQGTAALFSELKEMRPELLLLALSPVEAPLVIQAAADIVMDFDQVARAYSAALIAARMGRSPIVAISMSGSSDDWRLNARQGVLRAASTDMGLPFKALAVTKEGLGKALRELGITFDMDSTSGLASSPALDTRGGAHAGAAIVVNDGRIAPEVLRMAETSDILFIELDRPEKGYEGRVVETASASTVASVPAAVPGNGLPKGSMGGDLVRTLIDSARNPPGRPGLTLVWPGEQIVLLELGALIFARNIVDGKPVSEVGLATAMNTVWPAGQWHASHYVDLQTGVRARNHLLTGSDPYLVGRSYLSSETRSMPVKYRQMTDR